jgi:hypothetical protein
VPEGVITSKIEDDGSSKWYWVTTCGDECEEDYDSKEGAYADLINHCANICRERKDDCWKSPVEHTPASIPNKAGPKPAAEEKRIGDDLFIREGIISLIPVQVKAKRNDGNNYSAFTGCDETPPWCGYYKTEDEARQGLVAKCKSCEERRRYCWNPEPDGKSLCPPPDLKLLDGEYIIEGDEGGIMWSVVTPRGFINCWGEVNFEFMPECGNSSGDTVMNRLRKPGTVSTSTVVSVKTSRKAAGSMTLSQNRPRRTASRLGRTTARLRQYRQWQMASRKAAICLRLSLTRTILSLRE